MTNLQNTLDRLSVTIGVNEIVKAGPPPPGLVPQSGDPEHPGRWVRSEDDGDLKGISDKIVEEMTGVLGHKPTSEDIVRYITSGGKIKGNVFKVGPPRPGLIPQSGNPEKPGRWVKPSSASMDQIVSTRREAFSELQRVERQAKNHHSAGRGLEALAANKEAQKLKDHIAELDDAANKKSAEVAKGRSALLAEQASLANEKRRRGPQTKKPFWGKSMDQLNEIMKAGPLPPKFGEDEEEEDIDKGRSALLAEIGKLRVKAGPPRPGLVPQSGDPDKPGRWIKPKSENPDDHMGDVARESRKRSEELHGAGQAAIETSAAVTELVDNAVSFVRRGGPLDEKQLLQAVTERVSSKFDSAFNDLKRGTKGRADTQEFDAMIKEEIKRQLASR